MLMPFCLFKQIVFYIKTICFLIRPFVQYVKTINSGSVINHHIISPESFRSLGPGLLLVSLKNQASGETKESVMGEEVSL